MPAPVFATLTVEELRARREQLTVTKETGEGQVLTQEPASSPAETEIGPRSGPPLGPSACRNEP